MDARGERGIERAVGHHGLRCRDPEAGVEARQEALEYGVCLGDGGGGSVAQFGHQPVLERTCGTFHAPLRLR